MIEMCDNVHVIAAIYLCKVVAYSKLVTSQRIIAHIVYYAILCKQLLHIIWLQ